MVCFVCWKIDKGILGCSRAPRSPCFVFRTCGVRKKREVGIVIYAQMHFKSKRPTLDMYMPSNEKGRLGRGSTFVAWVTHGSPFGNGRGSKIGGRGGVSRALRGSPPTRERRTNESSVSSSASSGRPRRSSEKGKGYGRCIWAGP